MLLSMVQEQERDDSSRWAVVAFRGTLLGGVLGALSGAVLTLLAWESLWDGGLLFLGVLGGFVTGLLVGLVSSVMGLAGHALAAEVFPEASPWAAAAGSSVGAAVAFGVMLRDQLFTADANMVWMAIVLAGLLGQVLTRPLRAFRKTQ